jgi:hypothetical protein
MAPNRCDFVSLDENAKGDADEAGFCWRKASREGKRTLYFALHDTSVESRPQGWLMIRGCRRKRKLAAALTAKERMRA